MISYTGMSVTSRFSCTPLLFACGRVALPENTRVIIPLMLIHTRLYCLVRFLSESENNCKHQTYQTKLWHWNKLNYSRWAWIF